ncbi:hypothetical protein [Nocardia asteroides]|uniref:hypothetical protein n=2 Tax=Nocardia asteroides TaxID=1824 RepID=UPI003648A630
MVGNIPALEAMYYITQPLLTAGTVALIGVVAADADKFRAPSAGLLTLTITTFAFVASIQLYAHARKFIYSRAEVEQWCDPAQFRANERRIRGTQRANYERGSRQAWWAALCSNIGFVGLPISLAICLLPPTTAAGGTAAMRWVACALSAAVGLIALFIGIRNLGPTLENDGRRYRIRRPLDTYTVVGLPRPRG